MTDKVICPWCGAEMRVSAYAMDAFDYSAWAECTNNKCKADGPLATGHKTRKEAVEAAKAAALRRYTPQIKPMTLEEIKTASGVWVEDCMEDSEDSELYPAIYAGTRGNGSVTKVLTEKEYSEYVFFSNNVYGVEGGWRCWERKPTDEERSAAEWLQE